MRTPVSVVSSQSATAGRWRFAIWIGAALLTACASQPARLAPAPQTISASVDAGAVGIVPGVTAAKLTPDYWIARTPQPDAVLLEPAGIAAQNARLAEVGPAVLDLSTLPERLSAADVKDRIRSISSPPTATLYDEAGEPLSPFAIPSLLDALAIDQITDEVAVRWGMVLQRADLRAFPTTQRVFTTAGDTDIDRFQESALFPGTPVAILHTSADGEWYFIASKLYSAWVQARFVAEGDKAEVFGYARREPHLVVTGSNVRTVFTPERPELSLLQLDMGLRLPVLADWHPQTPVNGQLGYASHVIELPVRDKDGRLAFAPALLPRTSDVAPSPLPLTRANLIRQGFKFLGERYGWGHSYGTRDCSGFVSEVYRSFGVELPRNTSDQSRSTAFDRIAFSPEDGREVREAALAQVDVGDLIYIPGHVMMVIGREDGKTWLIHDTTGTTVLDEQGQLLRLALNQVSVTPLEPLRINRNAGYVDAITAIQRLHPNPTRSTP
jgi:cell wall-associated NlpC family hydrolase